MNRCTIILRMKTALRGQAGNTLISTLVGSVVGLLIVGVVGVGIVVMLTLDGKLGANNAVTADLTGTDAALRSDITFASTITSSTDKSLSLVVPGQSGECLTADWVIEEVAGGAQLARTVTTYPEFDASVNPVQCKGEAGTPHTTVTARSVDDGASFGYANAAGRTLVAVAGSLEPGLGEARPSGVSATKWASTVPAAVRLNAVFGHSGAKPRGVWINQATTSLSSVVGPADMDSHMVPDKSLRAG